MPKERLLLIDESGRENNACRQKGWRLRGKRCYGEKNYRHNQRTSRIATLCQNRLQAPSVFEIVVGEILIKNMKKAQIVLLATIHFHQTDKIKSFIASVGCELLFLPLYSPDLNPIEHYWFKIKHSLRKKAELFKNFFDGVCEVLKNVTHLVY